MKYLLQRALLGALLLLCAAEGMAQPSQSTSPPAVAAVQTEQWQEYALEDAGFKALLPKRPKHDDKGGLLFKDRWQVQTEIGRGNLPITFVVTYAEATSTKIQSPATDTLLKFLRDTTVNELKGRLLNDMAIKFAGEPGRLFELALEGAGRVRIILVLHGARTYRLEAKTPGDSEAERLTAAKFFNSFSLLPAKPVKATALGDVDKLLSTGWLQAGSSGAPGEGNGGVLDGKAIKKPAPFYTQIAKRSYVMGTVVVKIAVDETGRVVAAQALSGHPLLAGPAVEASRQARFTPTLVNGKPIRVIGTITYNFRIE
jgi:TonB family protein